MNLEYVWLLYIGGIASALVGLVGITEIRKATPIRDLLSESERRAYDNQLLVTTGQRLCPSCNIRYTRADFCDICEKVRTLQMVSVQTEPREPEQIVKNVVVRGTRSHVGYRPLYMQDGFEDMFKEQEDE